MENLYLNSFSHFKIELPNTGVTVLHNIVRDPRVRLISSGVER